MRKFRKEDYIGTTLERFVLWGITALLMVLIGYIYFEVAEDTFAMWLMIFAALLHVVVDIVCVIAKKVNDYLEDNE